MMRFAMLVTITVFSTVGHAQEVSSKPSRDLLGMIGSTEGQIVKMFGPPAERKKIDVPNGRNVEVLVFLGIYPDCELVAVMNGGNCTRVLLSLNNRDGTSRNIDESMVVEILTKLREWTRSDRWHVDHNPVPKLVEGHILLFRNEDKRLQAYVNKADRSLIVICP